MSGANRLAGSDVAVVLDLELGDLRAINLGDEAIDAYKQMSGGGAEIADLLMDIRGRVERGELSAEIGLDMNERLTGMLSDLEALPKRAGDAVPEERDLRMVKSVGTMGALGMSMFNMTMEGLRDGKDGVNPGVGELYNSFCSYDPGRGEKVWAQIMKVSTFEECLERCAQVLAADINATGGDALELARADVKAAILNAPTRYLNAKNAAKMLVDIFRDQMTEAFENEVKIYVEENGGQLIAGEDLERPELFVEALEVSRRFLKLDEMANLEMLRNDLGQAQTADPDKAESYFRKMHGVEGTKVENNFGYVYLDKAQYEELDFTGARVAGVEEFTYFGQPYYAVPVGAYFSGKDVEMMDEAICSLHELAEAYPDTPVAIYYDLLIKYYDLPFNYVQAGGGKSFNEEYYELCYEAERAWVAYVKYAAENNLPFIHVHPFEKYSTTSTKSHDLALAIVDKAGTRQFLDGKKSFADNAQKFLNNWEGLADVYPEMAAESMRLIGTVGVISLAARMGSSLHGTIAQNIPNEEPGRRDGVNYIV